MNPRITKLVTALNDLDRELILIDGKMVKPSQCFRYETDPLHFMFNTNCPKDLRQQVQAIFEKHSAAEGSEKSPKNQG